MEDNVGVATVEVAVVFLGPMLYLEFLLNIPATMNYTYEHQQTIPYRITKDDLIGQYANIVQV